MSTSRPCDNFQNAIHAAKKNRTAGNNSHTVRRKIVKTCRGPLTICQIHLRKLNRELNSALIAGGFEPLR